MKKFNQYIIEKLRVNKDSKVDNKEKSVKIINRLYTYLTSDNKKIINYMLTNFVEACLELANTVKNPAEVFNSPETYDKFLEKFGKDTGISPEKYSIIYENIPDDECAKIYQKEYKSFPMTCEEFKHMFGPGEFPIITIYIKRLAGNTYTFYTISR